MEFTHEILLSFLIVGITNLLAVISPGPDFIIVVKTAMTQTRQKSILTALGIASGLLVHATYCVLGLAIIIVKSILLFNLIKYLGAAYFIYLGIHALLEKKATQSVHVSHQAKAISNFTAFKRGFLCNVLNPKAALFILGVFTLVVKPNTPFFVQVLYGLEICLIAFAWFTILSVLITHAPVKRKLNKIQYYLTKFMGGLLIFFGVELALFHRR